MFAYDLEFLRPWWFLALLPSAYLFWKLWQRKVKEGAWHQVIAPEFQSLLLGSDKAVDQTLFERAGLYGLAFIWTLGIFALAGPSMKAVEIPAQKSQQGTVIVLDLSLSMLADDLSPNRLSQARFKIEDLLNRHPELSIGLVAYAGTAHTVSPISQDNQTLLGLLPTLNPLIMPAFGANPMAGFTAAKALLDGAHVMQGHIIWITDDIETAEIQPITDWFKSNGYSLSIVTAGSEQGGMVEIPNYGLLKDKAENIIVPRVPLARFAQLSQNLQAGLMPLRIEQEDLTPILPPEMVVSIAEEDEKSVTHRIDEGAALIILLLPLALLLYRRGWVFVLPLAIALPMSSLTPTPAFANEQEDRIEDLKNMFQSHDQQGYKAWVKGNYEAAEALFDDAKWRASSLFRLGRYEEAQNLFERDVSADGRYNLGNALAYQGKLEEAKKAYQQALKTDPNHVQAKENLALVEQWLQERAKSPQPNEGEQSSSGQASNSSGDTQNEAKQQNQQGQNQQQQPSEQGNQGEDSQQADAQAAQDQEQQAKDSDNKESSQQDSQSAQQSQQQNNESGEQSNQSSSETESAGAQSSQQGQQSGEQADSQSAQSGQQQNQNSQQNAQSGNQSSDEKQVEAASEAMQQMMQEAQAQKEEAGEHPDKDQAQQGDNDSQNNEQSGQGQIPSQLGENGAGDASGLSREQQEQQQAQQNWLSQIPDQPGVFLQRKFQYQYEREPMRKQMEKSW